jgi:hypothetical protein
VRVGVHRLRDRGVPEKGRYDLRMLAPLEVRRREGVAQGVEREVLVVETGPLEERLVVAVVEVVVVRRATDAVGEDDVMVALLGGRQPILVLAGPVRQQDGHDGTVEGYGTAARLVLGRAEVRAIVRNLQRPTDGEPGGCGVEVNAQPAETEELALQEPSVDRHDVQGLEADTPRRGEKRPYMS